MIRSLLIVCFIIYSIGANPVERNGTEVCELGGYFVPANGYGWAKRDRRTICTCPDSVYTIDQPCRICDREGICGHADALCSEELELSDSKLHFSCFCPSGTFQVGEKCSEENTTPPITTQSTTSTTAAPGTTTSTATTTSTSTSVPIAMTTTTTTTTTAIVTSTVTTTTTTVTTSITTTEITTTSTQCVPPRSSGSRLWMQPALMIVLNVVYFSTK